LHDGLAKAPLPLVMKTTVPPGVNAGLADRSVTTAVHTVAKPTLTEDGAQLRDMEADRLLTVTAALPLLML